ncbi:unnamed protein product, partial [Ectocarpus sp. 12 AP-2014]
LERDAEEPREEVLAGGRRSLRTRFLCWRIATLRRCPWAEQDRRGGGRHRRRRVSRTLKATQTRQEEAPRSRTSLLRGRSLLRRSSRLLSAPTRRRCRGRVRGKRSAWPCRKSFRSQQATRRSGTVCGTK